MTKTPVWWHGWLTAFALFWLLVNLLGVISNALQPDLFGVVASIGWVFASAYVANEAAKRYNKKRKRES